MNAATVHGLSSLINVVRAEAGAVAVDFHASGNDLVGAADRRIEDGLTCCAQGRGTHTSAAPGGRLGSDSGYGRLEIWLEFRGTPACPRR
jgi:hypothetical protein